MVEQMLSNMKKTAASSCSKAKVTFRPKTFNRPMFNGTTGRKQVQELSDTNLQFMTRQNKQTCFPGSLEPEEVTDIWRET